MPAPSNFEIRWDRHTNPARQERHIRPAPPVSGGLSWRPGHEGTVPLLQGDGHAGGGCGPVRGRPAAGGARQGVGCGETSGGVYRVPHGGVIGGHHRTGRRAGGGAPPDRRPERAHIVPGDAAGHTQQLEQPHLRQPRALRGHQKLPGGGARVRGRPRCEGQ